MDVYEDHMLDSFHHIFWPAQKIRKRNKEYMIFKGKRKT